MKTIVKCVVILFIIIAPVTGQENYKVIKVNGTILLKTKGISLETGTVFSEKDDLLFRSDDATAAVINSQQGRLVLTSKNHNLSSAKSNQMPSMYNIGSKGISFNDDFDLADQFSGKHVVFDKEAVKVEAFRYPMDETNFFFLRYNYKGEEINKKLSFSGDTLFIEKSTLFTVDGIPIPSADNTSIKLFYRSGAVSTIISEFDLIFPDMEQLTKEIEIMLSEMTEKTVNQKVNEIDSYLIDFYGKVSRENLKSWLEINFGIK